MPETETRDVNVLRTEQLIPPADLLEKLPSTPAAERTDCRG